MTEHPNPQTGRHETGPDPKIGRQPARTPHEPEHSLPITGEPSVGEEIEEGGAPRLTSPEQSWAQGSPSVPDAGELSGANRVYPAGGEAARGTEPQRSAGGGSSAPAGVVETAQEVKDVALSEASQLSDDAIRRSADLAATAQAELSAVTQEFRTQWQGLWSQTADQLREQAGNGQHHLAQVVHSLSQELGQMAARSQEQGPLTAFARSAAAQGGRWSHWLETSDPADVLTQIRRFARRRPWVFLAGATAAGVVVGRLSRGLMAGAPSAASEHPSRPVPAASAPMASHGPKEDSLITAGSASSRVGAFDDGATPAASGVDR